MNQALTIDCSMTAPAPQNHPNRLQLHPSPVLEYRLFLLVCSSLVLNYPLSASIFIHVRPNTTFPLFAILDDERDLVLLLVFS